MHGVPVWHMKMEIALDFQIFEAQDFDILIGHPVEKIFLDVSVLGRLDVSLGGKSLLLAYRPSQDVHGRICPPRRTN